MAEQRDIREEWKSLGHDQVFSFWEELSAEGQHELLESLRNVGDPGFLQSTLSGIFDSSPGEEKLEVDSISPFTRVMVKEDASQEDQGKWLRSGLEAISRGEVAVVTLAGGQGTRLGSANPKGCFDIGLPSGKTLFQIQADRIVALRDLAAKVTQTLDTPAIPWYIMTSHSTDEPTKAFFQDNDFFDLLPGQLRFLKQGVMPAVDPTGKVLLETRSSIALSPDGNGGIYAALARSGSIQHMESLGIRWVHTVGIDNVLVKPADPSMVGFGESCPESQIINKVVPKKNPEEKVGVMCLRNGEPGVVEYSEITQEMSKLRVPGSEFLQFGSANIAEHVFRFPFLKKVCHEEQDPLPWHQAAKKIPHLDLASGIQVQPAKPNGIKLEKFIFDVFRLDPNMYAFVVDRAQEFSPVKNAQGPASPASARADLSWLHRSWIESILPTLVFQDSGVLEVCPRVAYSAETSAEKVQIRRAVGDRNPLVLPCFITRN